MALAASRKAAALPPAAKPPTGSRDPPRGAEPIFGQLGKGRVQFDAEPVAVQALRDDRRCAGAHERIEDDAGAGRREALAATKLADLSRVPHPLVRPLADDPRRPGPGGVALHADPFRAGGEDLPLDQRLGEGGLV